MKSRLRIAALVLAVAMLSGCTPTGNILTDAPLDKNGDVAPSSSTIPGQKKEITLAFSPEDSMNPYQMKSENNLRLSPLIYEGLFTATESFTAKNALCENYSFEGNTWNFSVKQGVAFHNGAPLTAKDVEFSIKAAQASEHYAPSCANIASVSTRGKYELEITLNAPDSLLPLLLTMPIIPNNSMQTPSGTGMYVVNQQDGSVFLSANESYSGGAPTIKLINLSAIYEDSELAYIVGSSIVDAVAYEKPFEAATPIRGTFDTATYATTDFHYIGINRTGELLSSPAVRRVISQAISREQIVQKAFSGYADETKLPISPEFSSIKSKIEPLGTLIKQGGFADTDNDGILNDSTGKQLKFTMLVPEENLVKKQAANVVAGSLSTAGISVSVEPLPQEEFLSRVHRGDFELYYGETILNSEFDISPLVAAGGGANFSGESVATATYINELKNAPSGNLDKARAELYGIFEQDMPLIPLAFGRGCVVSAKNVMNQIVGASSNPYYNIASWASAN